MFDSQDIVSLDDIFDYLKGKRKISGVLPFFQKRKLEIEQLINIDYSKNTLKVYNSTLKHLTRFVHKLKRKDYPLKQVDYRFVDQFFKYLKLERGCNTNSANKYLKTLKAVLNEAKKEKLISSTPFETFKIKAGTYNRTYLNEDELQRIIEAPLEKHSLNLVRDFFIFVCFTGLHYSDVESLRTKDIVLRKNQKWIVKSRTKNGEQTLVPLLKNAEDIINKHKLHLKKPEGVLKMYSNPKTNQYLKEIARLCNIDKNLTCRVGRHTFATTVTLSNSVPLESVSHMLGHTSIKTTQIYARVVSNKLLNDMSMVQEKYG